MAGRGSGNEHNGSGRNIDTYITHAERKEKTEIVQGKNNSKLWRLSKTGGTTPIDRLTADTQPAASTPNTADSTRQARPP